jgi:energy-coupling factor transporter ATP-binding protein EcfA2
VDRGLSAIWVTQDAAETAAADRIVRLGDPGPLQADLPARAPESPGPPLLTLRIAPLASGEGPRIRVSSELVIQLSSTGVVAVEGPNGAGKSVLLSAAVGLLRLDQVEVVPLRAPEAPPLLVTQYPELQIFEEKVSDEIVYAATCRGVPREVALRSAARILERLGFDAENFLGRRTWSLSGGEKRMLSLAGALVTPASLLAIDEPTAGLDAGRRAALAGLIAETGTRRALLLASQDREWLSRVAMRAHSLDASGGSCPGNSQQGN